MPRDLPIGNGSLLINYDQDYNIRDIYYPNVGGIEHTLGHASRLGLWSEGNFSWIYSAEWKKSLKYQENTLVTHVVATNQKLGFSITINDVVDYQENVLLRKFTIKNLSHHSRQARIYSSHDLHLSESQVGDTAYYDPRIKSIIHYKRSQYFLINCMSSDNYGVDEYAVGVQDFRNAEGTWRDAEDGILSGDSVADGSVDSTIGISFSVPEKGESIVYCWIIAGKSYGEVTSLNNTILDKSPEYFIRRTANYWKSWLTQGKLPKDIGTETDFIHSDNIHRLYELSLLILQTQIDKGGAITAGNDWDTADMGMDKYSYMWPRDGAMITYALDKAGFGDTTERFFRFCANVITPEGYFLHKYHPDGTIGSTWHTWLSEGQKRLPIQEDGTALIVWSFWKHFQRYNNIELLGELYEPLVIRPANFIVNYMDKSTGLPLPSYDLWEERYGIHIYTTAAVCAGLRGASELAEIMGDSKNSEKYRQAEKQIKKAMDEYLYDREHAHFLRMITNESGEYHRDFTIDSSSYATFAFEIYDADDPRVISTMKAIQDKLAVKTNIGGIARYNNDYLHRTGYDFDNVPGNPWLICTLWVAQHLIAKAKTTIELDKSIPILKWILDHAFDSGVLPEQLNPYTGQPLSISPLSWSHGEFIITVHNYLEKLRQITGD